MIMLYDYIKLLRLKDWLKNLLIFLPFIFSYKIFEHEQYNIEILSLFIFFSLLCSSIYIINDFRDIKIDKLDKYKIKFKPLASGIINENNAKVLIFFLFFLICVYLFFSTQYIIFFALYFIMNIFYSFLLKKIIFLDIIIVALGYNLRVEMGSELIEVSTSNLMHLSIFFLALFALSNKRNTNIISNKRYNKNKFYKMILKFLIYFSLLMALIFYLIFIIQNNFFLLLISLPIVLYIMFRYVFLSRNIDFAINPIEIVTNDKKIFSSILLYFICVVMILYTY